MSRAGLGRTSGWSESNATASWGPAPTPSRRPEGRQAEVDRGDLLLLFLVVLMAKKATSSFPPLCWKRPPPPPPALPASFRSFVCTPARSRVGSFLATEGIVYSSLIAPSVFGATLLGFLFF